MQVTARGHGVPFGGDKNVRELDSGDVAQRFEYTKTH